MKNNEKNIEEVSKSKISFEEISEDKVSKINETDLNKIADKKIQKNLEKKHHKLKLSNALRENLKRRKKLKIN